MIVVPGSGVVPCDLMAIGEAPGREEGRIGRPLVGPSGAAFNWHLNRHGLSISQFYLDNVCRLYQDGNPDPSPAQIEEWTPALLATIAEVRPKVIVPLGRYACRWFLGDGADMDSCHGIPHLGGEWDAIRKDRAHGAIIIPCYHPAAGLHNSDFKTLIDFDLARAAEIIRLVRGGRSDLVKFRRDTYAGKERYSDVTGAELRRLLAHHRPMHVGYDTEGDPEDPGSLQISWEPGTGYMLRRDQDDFHAGVEALQQLVATGCTFAVHDAGTPRGTGYDTQVSRTCGLELRDANLDNTMYRAYALRIEPKGLKPLLWRWCGMRQDDYMSLIGDIGRQMQIEYLERVAARKDWPRVPATVALQNDGTLKAHKFGKLESRARAILADIAKDKRDKDGNPVDPRKRWRMLEPELRKLAESDIGKLPHGNYRHIDLDKFVFYGCRDADGEGRLLPELAAECKRMGVDGVCWTGNQVLPIFEEMQHEGMPASRRAFVDLATTVTREMHEIQAGLSANWFDGRPFNPAPNTKDVATLVRRLGITGLKTTKKAKVPSTSMKSLEHLSSRYPAIKEVGEWRRRQKVLNTYCLPLIEMADRQLELELEKRPLGDQSDLFLVRGNIKPVSVETRRLAMADPSLLNQPIRTELGRKVRACYMTMHKDAGNPDDEVFIAVDFSAQEVRVAAHVSADPLLCAIMRDETRDIHLETASRVFGKPIDQIKKIEERVPAKTAFFGVLYGMSGAGLLDLFRSFGLETWALSDCENLVAEIFKIYPGLLGAIKLAKDEVTRAGMVRDLYGHIRYLPAIWSGKRGEVAEAERQAFSHKIQSTAQGMTQNSMVTMKKPVRDLQRAGLFAKFTLQIHDEILMRTKRWMYDVVYGIMADAMIGGYGGPTGVKLRVPVLVDGHYSTHWSKLK